MLLCRLSTRSIAASIFGFGWVVAVPHAYAAITLDTENQSTVVAYANQGLSSDSKINNVNFLPFTTPTSVVFGNLSSTVTSFANISGFSFVFTQSVLDTSGFEAFASGEIQIYFTATDSTTYSIAGSGTLNTGADGGGFDVEITDLAAGNSNVYVYDGSSLPSDSGALTVGISGGINEIGSPTGLLIEGHSYRFSANVEALASPVFSEANLTANIGITFGSPVPEPTSLSLLAAGGAGLLRRRRSAYRELD